MTDAQKVLLLGSAPWLTRRDYPKLVNGLQAWFDETDPDSMIYDSSNRVALVSDKSGNSGVGSGRSTGLILTGASSGNATIPDSAALSITGDIDIRVDLAAVNWVPAAIQLLVTKNAAGQISFDFRLNFTDGKLYFYTSPDGTAQSAGVSSVATGYTDGSRGWVRVTRVATTGVIVFYTSSDGISWSQLGTPTSNTAGSIFDGTSLVAIGTSATGGNAFKGTFYRVQIYNGIAGTLALDTNFVGQRTNAVSFTESSSNAATVTINGTALLGWVDSQNCLYTPGTAANYASSPDSAAVSITGDLDLRCLAAPDSLAPGVSRYLISKWLATGVGPNSYIFGTTGTGTLELAWSTTGANTISVVSTATVPVSNYASLWLRATLDVDNGAAGNTVTFYTSTDGSTWTQLGSPVVTAGVTSIFDSAALINLSGFNVGNQSLWVGRIYRAQIYNGIAGTLVFDANFANCPKLASSFIESSTNAAVVTINTSGATGARVSGARDLYQGTVANQPILTIAASGNYLTFDGSDDYLKAAAFSLSQPETVYFVGSQVSWVSGDAFFDGNALGNGMAVAQNSLTPALSLFAGTQISDLIAPALNTRSVISAVFSGASSFLRLNRNTAASASVGVESGNGFTLGCVRNTTGFANITAQEVVIYSAAHTTAQQDRVIRYLARKHRLPAV